MMQSITRALKQFGGLRRSRAQVVTTSDGREIPWPTYDDTANKGRLIAEAKSRSSTDVTFGAAMLHAYGYSSDFIKVSFELLQDAEVDVVGMIGGIAGERVGRITAQHFTTGDGASKPYGVLTQAPSGVTAASATEVEWDELLDLKHSVDPAYRESPQWMFNDTTLKELKKLKDGDGEPLWQSNVQLGAPPTIDGDPYVVNQEMPNTAASQKAVLYGDFSLYKIRDVSGMQLRRLDERFADEGQVAFILFSRHDGVLVDAGQGPLKALTMAA
jgi:HK97 family phage major capsid protein